MEKYFLLPFNRKGDGFRSFLKKASPKTFIIS